MWGQDLQVPFPSSLAHVPLGVLILCFGISLVWGRICALFLSSLAHVPSGFDPGFELLSGVCAPLPFLCPCGFDLVFESV
jgi:hypothetical protein